MLLCRNVNSVKPIGITKKISVIRVFTKKNKKLYHLHVNPDAMNFTIILMIPRI